MIYVCDWKVKNLAWRVRYRIGCVIGLSPPRTDETVCSDYRLLPLLQRKEGKLGGIKCEDLPLDCDCIKYSISVLNFIDLLAGVLKVS